MQRRRYNPASVLSGEEIITYDMQVLTIVIHDNHSHFTLQRLGYHARFSSSSSTQQEALHLQNQREVISDRLNKYLFGFAIQSLVALLGACIIQSQSQSSTSSDSSSSTSACLKIFTISTLVLFCSGIGIIILEPAQRFRAFLNVTNCISTALAFSSLATMLLKTGYLWLVYLLGAFLLVVLFHYLCPLPWLLLHINLVWRRALRRQHVQDDHMSLARYNN